ncbi:MAG: sel1 repeat family protein [Planctomycetes bacterium]|nr:sel1 repeat family protein [Planctomycetota bacterium]
MAISRKQFDGMASKAAFGDLESQYSLGLAFINGSGVKRDVREGMRWLTRAAMGGHNGAQSNLACEHHESGDFKSAFKWWDAAAKKGDALSQYFLGSMYETGEGVQRDYVMAIKWYRKAARLGDESAARSIGVFYLQGWGVDKNYKVAAKWLKQASRKGDKSASLHLGKLYEKGNGVRKNVKKAVELYWKAAQDNDKDAIELLRSKKLWPV